MARNRNTGVFFRVLDDSHQDKRPQYQSTLRRWGRNEFNSTNESAPAEWETAWSQGYRRRKSFTLNCGTGRCTKRARRRFLHLARTFGINGPEMTAAGFRVGEIVGVYAYDTPSGLWGYMQGIADGNWVAEFNGIRLRDARVAETDAVQVKVIESIRVRPAMEFAAQHGFEVAEPHPGGMIDVDDGLTYEDDAEMPDIQGLSRDRP